jgi:serine protease Do
MTGSPAQAAGLRRGDVIVEFNGRKIVSQDILLEAVGHTAPKTAVTGKVVREGKTLSLPLVTGEAPSEPAAAGVAPAAPEPSRPVDWEGAQLAPVSAALAERYGFPAKERGAVVVSVASGGRAEAAGLAEGDLVGSFNREKTPDPASFLAAAKRADPRKGIVLDVFRRGRWIYLTYKEPQ